MKKSEIREMIKEELQKLSEALGSKSPEGDIRKIDAMSADDFLKNISAGLVWSWNYQKSPATYKGNGISQSFDKSLNKDYNGPKIEVITRKGGKVEVKKGGKSVLTAKIGDNGLGEKIYGSIKESKINELRSVRVIYDDGTDYTTSMASGLTDDEINDYFKVGRKFNVGGPQGTDKMAKVKKVKILK